MAVIEQSAAVIPGCIGPWYGGAPVNGTTLANQIPKGGLYQDTTNGILYVNTGTQASPVFTAQP